MLVWLENLIERCCEINLWNQRWAAPTIPKSSSAPAPANYDPLHSSSAPGLRIPLRLRSKLQSYWKTLAPTPLPLQLITTPLRSDSSSDSAPPWQKKVFLLFLKCDDVPWILQFISRYTYTIQVWNHDTATPTLFDVLTNKCTGCRDSALVPRLFVSVRKKYCKNRTKKRWMSINMHDQKKVVSNESRLVLIQWIIRLCRYTNRWLLTHSILSNFSLRWRYALTFRN